jgi:hypothetical protein
VVKFVLCVYRPVSIDDRDGEHRGYLRSSVFANTKVGVNIASRCKHEGAVEV